MFRIAYTGHRPKDLLGYKGDYAPIVRQIKNHLKGILDQHLNESFTVITGGAQGVDQIAFWVAYRLKKEYKIKTVVAVPFNGQQSCWPEDTLFGQAQYRQMIEKADEIEVLSTSSWNAIQKLDQRNKWMVNNSDLLICVTPYDDITTRKGGTANCLKYAIEQDHPYDICHIEL